MSFRVVAFLGISALACGCTTAPRPAPEVSFAERTLVSAPFDAEVVPFSFAWSPTGRAAALGLRRAGRCAMLVNQQLGPEVDELDNQGYRMFPWIVFDHAGERAAYLVKLGGKKHVVDFEGRLSPPYDEVLHLDRSPVDDTLAWVGRIERQQCVVYDGDEGDLFDDVLRGQHLFDAQGRPEYLARDAAGWHLVQDGTRHGPFEGAQRCATSCAAREGASVRAQGEHRFIDRSGTPGEPFDGIYLAPDQDGRYFGKMDGRWFDVRGAERAPLPEVAVPFRPAGGDLLAVVDDGRRVVLAPTAEAATFENVAVHAVLPDGRAVTCAHDGYAFQKDKPKRLAVGLEVDPRSYDHVAVTSDGKAWAAAAKKAKEHFLCTTSGARGPFEAVEVLCLRPDGAPYVALKQGGRWTFEGGPALAQEARELSSRPAQVPPGDARRAVVVVERAPVLGTPERLVVVVFEPGREPRVEERRGSRFAQLQDVRLLPSGAVVTAFIDTPDIGKEPFDLARASFHHVLAAGRLLGPFDWVGELRHDAAGRRVAFGALAGRELLWKSVELP